MKTRQLIVLLTVCVLGVTTFSYAEGQGIHERVRQAHEQIERGIRSGSLTREEAHRLRNELNSVRDDEARMKADGRLSHSERARLEKELDRLERHIFRAKTNDDRGHRR
jgi:septal ring factor EnvC (AmiA/AmiB activator)